MGKNLFIAYVYLYRVLIHTCIVMTTYIHIYGSSNWKSTSNTTQSLETCATWNLCLNLWLSIAMSHINVLSRSSTFLIYKRRIAIEKNSLLWARPGHGAYTSPVFTKMLLLGWRKQFNDRFYKGVVLDLQRVSFVYNKWVPFTRCLCICFWPVLGSVEYVDIIRPGFFFGKTSCWCPPTAYSATPD